MARRMLLAVVIALLLASSVAAHLFLRTRRPAGAEPIAAEGAIALLGGLRSLAAEVLWFRLDRLQEEGRYVELAQMASALSLMEPHTTEVWSFAAWNLAYNVSVMMPTAEDRWRWVEAAMKLLRDEGLKLNPRSPELCRELAWMFEIKLGTNIDTAAPHYRQRWRERVADVAKRGAWNELGMDATLMARVEQATGFDDWADVQLSAIYWAMLGNCRDIFEQASILYKRNHK